MRGRFFIIATTLATVFIGGRADAITAPPAGTVIGNKSSADYQDPFGQSYTIASNVVETTVYQVASLSLVSPGSKTTSPGNTLYFPHTLTNTGNGSDTFTLSVTNASGDNFDLSVLAIYADQDGDGFPDNQTPVTTTGVLPPDGTFRFVAAGTAPGVLSAGVTGKLQVQAASVFTPTQTDTNEDTLLVSGNAAISVVESISTSTGKTPSGPHTYTLTYTNTGSTVANDLTLTAVIPADMTYVTGGGLWSVSGATPLTDTPGDTQGTLPDTIDYAVSGTTITAVIATVASGQSGTLTFPVMVNSGLPAKTISHASSFEYKDGSTTIPAAGTNTVNFTVLQEAGVTVDPPAVIPVANQGATVSFDNTVTNTGNGPDTFDMTLGTSTFPTETTFALYQADGVTPLTDTDGNGIPDTGTVALGGTTTVVVKAILPSKSSGGGPYTVELIGTSTFDPTKTDNAINQLTTIAPNTVDLTNDAIAGGTGVTGGGHGPEEASVKTVSVQMGTTTSLSLFVNNTSPSAEHYDLAVSTDSSFNATTLPSGWTIVFKDAQGGVTTNTGSIPAGRNINLFADLFVPTGAVNGMNDIFFRVLSQGSGAGDILHDGILVIQDAGVRVTEPAVVPVVNQGATVLFNNTVTNTGNGPDSFDMTFGASTFPAGTTFQLYQADGVTPLPDSNGNSVPDTGTVARAGTTTVVVKAILPPKSSGGGPYTVELIGTSVFDPKKTDPAVDQLTTIAPNTVDLSNDAIAGGTGATGGGPGPEAASVKTVSVNAGTTTRLSLFVNNTSPVAETYDLAVSTDRTFATTTLPSGWTVVFKDLKGGIITNTGSIPAGQHVNLFAEVAVPAGIPSGTNDISFRALSGMSGAGDILHDAVTINRIRNITLAPNQARQVVSGDTVTYMVTLSNLGNEPETGLVLTATNDQSEWTSTFYEDTNGNGTHDSNDSAITGPLTLPAVGTTGSATTLFVKVASPAGSAPGTVNLSALSATGDSLIATAILTTTVIAGGMDFEIKQAPDKTCDGTPDTPFALAVISVDRGSCIRYQVTATNSGLSDMINVVITTVTPDHTRYKATPQAVITPGTVTSDPVDNAIGSMKAKVPKLAPTESAVLTFSVFVFPEVTAGVALPKAGTSIPNEAKMSYQAGVGGLFSKLMSNTVSAEVLPFYDLALQADHTQHIPPGISVTLPHRLTNTGNVTTSYTLDFKNQSGDDYDLANLTLILDQNSNGVADSGEPVFTGGTLTLDPKATRDLVITGEVPVSALPKGSARVTLTATTVQPVAGQPKSVTNTDTLIAQSAALLTLMKSPSSFTPKPLDTVEFTLSGTNIGTELASGISVMIDGQSQTRVIVRDVIPANTTFVQFGSGSSGTPLYHHFGDPLHTYSTAPSSQLQAMDAVGYALTTVPVQQGFRFSFSVQVSANTGGTVKNTGEAFFHNAIVPVVLESNTVVLTLPSVPPQIEYFADGTFTTKGKPASPGDNLYVQAETKECNADPLVVDTRNIIMASKLTGDMETFVGTESSPNSGKFQILPFVITEDIALPNVVVKSGDGRLQLAKNDTVTAEVEGCGGGEADATLLIDPFGVVSDSRNGAPLSGAGVRLVDAVTGVLATVLDEDGLMPSPNPVTTGADGKYSFPLVPDGDYRITVISPAGYQFPSSRPPDLLPPGLVIDPNVSYGRSFPINVTTGVIHADLPLDFVGSTGLLLQKSASKTVVEIGDFLDYTIRVKNVDVSVMDPVKVVDIFPPGFIYRPGTLRQDGVPVNDPVLSKNGESFTATVGTLPAKQEVTLTYTLHVGVGAEGGSGINSAQAFVPDPNAVSQGSKSSKPNFAPLPSIPSAVLITSNIGTAVVRLGTFFTQEAYLFGKVYADCSGDTDHRDRIQNEGELGIPGVRLYLENGTFVITDNEGKYSLYGLSPRTHHLRIDRATLPVGANLVELANRNAGDPASRFVDLKRGEFHKADFAVEACSEESLREINRRRTEALQWGEGLDIQPSSGADSERSSGGNASVFESPRPLTVEASASDRSSQTAEPIRSEATGESRLAFVAILQDQDNTLDFIGLKEGDILRNVTNIRIKGASGTPITLRVNGKEIPEDRMGEEVAMPDRELVGKEYIGVSLAAGENVLELVQEDRLGNRSAAKRMTVKAPGEIRTIELVLPEHPISDGTATTVSVRLLDANGVLVTSRTPLTLESLHSRWKVEDLDPVTPGVQQFLEGGVGEYTLIAPVSPGEETVRVSSGLSVMTEKRFSYFPVLRPMIAAGLIEGTFNFRKLDPNAIFPTRREDDFEEVIERWSDADDEHRIAGRAALFLKGKIKGDYLLTLGYDSDKDKERLFRDIQPDQFYPIYGDSSVRGFDAQSTERLYVRVDKNQSYFLYGDYTTRADSPGVNLGAVNRSLTGAFEHYQNDRVTANLYASEGRLTQQVEEFEANGTSGPFFLKSALVRENSEQVEIVVRDRNQPSVILSRTLKTRFQDYAFESFRGRLLFTGPISSVDKNLNPVFIRVSYEVEAGGDPFWIVGGEASVKITDRVSLGATRMDDRNPQTEHSLTSAHLVFDLGEKTRLITEAAFSEQLGIGKGDGARADLTHTGEKLTARLYVGRTDVTFENPQAGLGKGRAETGLQLRYKIGSQTHLATEAVQTEDILINGRRRGALVSLEQSLDDHFHLETGLRYAEETAAPASSASIGATPLETTSARLKISAQAPKMPELTGYGEYEQALDHARRRVAAAGGEYRFPNRGRLYLRHEWMSSLSGGFALNSTQRQDTTLVGMDTPYMTGGNVFSEYRIQDTIAGPDAQAAIGVRNLWNLSEATRISGGFERTKKVSGVGDVRESTAVTSGIEHLRPLWKGTGRLEWRDANTETNILNTLGLIYKLDTRWSLLARNIFATTDSKQIAQNDRTENRLQIGAAYRPVLTNRWGGLFRLEEKLEEEGAKNRQSHILSTHVNYQPSAPLIMSGRYAVRQARETFSPAQKNVTHLVRARLTCDVTAHVDVGFTGSRLFNDDGAHKSGLGAEVGYLLAGNFWVSGGYNWFGFSDPDLAGGDYTQKGPYLRLRFKFDEDLFDRPPTLDSRRNTRRGWGCWQQEPPAPPAPVEEVKAVPVPQLAPQVESVVAPEPEAPIEETPLPPLPVQEAEPEPEPELQPEPEPAPEPEPVVLPVIEAIVMPDVVHFAFDRATLHMTSRSILDRVAEVLKENPDVTVSLQGHTDIWGSIAYNKGLSARRSRAVLNYLLNAGVSSLQLTSASFGEEKPRFRGTTRLDHARNRRVEIVLMTGGKIPITMVSQEDDLQISRRQKARVEARNSSRRGH